MKIVIKFLGRFKKYRAMIGAFLLVQLLTTVVSLAMAEVLRLSVNSVTTTGISGLKTAAILAVVSTVVYLILDLIIKPLRRIIINKCEQHIQNLLLDTIFSIDKLELNNYKSGDIVTRITSNATTAIDLSLSAFLGICEGVGVLAAGVIYMGYLNVYLMLAVVLYNLMFRRLLALLDKKIKERSKTLVNVVKGNNSFLVDVLRNLTTIVIFRKEKYFKDKLFVKETETLNANSRLYAVQNGLFEVMWFILKVAELVIVYGLGGYLAYRGIIDFGVILAYVIALDLFTKGINSCIYAFSDKSTAIPNINMVEEFFAAAKGDESGSGEIKEEVFDIIFENVSFSFGEKEVLKNLNFKIKSNEKILIAGPNGQGKSTLLNLLLGLYRPVSGRILFGTRDTSGINIKSLCGKYSYISQDSYLFGSSLCENIALSEDYDEKKCDGILSGLNLSHLKNNDASTISKGEKQRVNIGRAIYKSDKTHVLIGDEIFSNIDIENQKSISRYINDKFSDKTMIMVSHEDMPLKFDKIFYVNNMSVEISSVI